MQAYSSLYNQTLNGTPALLPHSSPCHSTLPAHRAGGEALHRACTRAALPQGSGELGIFLIQPAQEPTEPLGWQGQGTTWPRSNHKFSPCKGQQPGAKEAPAAVECLWTPLQRESRSQLDFHSSILFQLEVSISKGRKFTLSSWQCF